MAAPYVAALLHEREGYLRAGMAARLRAVDAELARFGVAVDDTPEKAVDAAPERAVKSKPRPPRKPRG